MTSAAPALRVMEGYAAIVETTNPYIVQLDEALRNTAGLTVLTYSPRAALRGGYDVLHLHWPENMFGGHTRRGRVARRLLTTLILLRLSLTGTPIVRTTHNLYRPDGLGWYDHRLLDWIDRLTRVQIRLNDQTALPLGAVTHTIAHGHYRDWFAGYDRPSAEPGRLGYIGLIRRYKGVEDLLAAFSDLADPQARLRITGKPSTTELATTIEDLAARDPRVSLRLEFVDESGFATEVASSALMVMPYRHMHNSGVALAALSLDRPVLVPDTEVNRALAHEVGPGWVHLFSGTIDAEDLAAAVAAAALPREHRPDLSGREWDSVGAAHLAAFRDARTASR